MTNYPYVQSCDRLTIDTAHVLPEESRGFARVQRLKKRVVEATNYVCMERACIVTQVYKENEAEEIYALRAKVFDRLMREMSVYILDDELIVGHQAEKQRSAPLFPEYAVQWIMDELDLFSTRGQDKFVVPPEVRREFVEEIYPYWKGKTFNDRVLSDLPEDVKLLRMDAQLYSTNLHEGGGLGHVYHDYSVLLTQGLSGIKQRMSEQLLKLDDTVPENIPKIRFYHATTKMCDAIIAYAHRYSALALELAKKETDKARKAELVKIAEVCANVPEFPAKSFHEALQSLWFLQMLAQVYDNAVSITPGRLDQYMYPYYEADVMNGVLTKEQAQELLEVFWVKFTEPIKLYDADSAASHAGYPMGQNLSVGGVDRDGKDATNDLSFRILEAHSHVLLMQPNFSVRLHNGSPYAFLRAAVEAIKLGNGMPQLVNDEMFVPALMNAGVTLQDARDYAPVGCVECSPLDTFGRLNGGYFNLAKIFELAMSNGVCRITGKQVGPKTGDARAFTSFEQVLQAYDQQMEYGVRSNVKWNNMLDFISRDRMPVPLTSILVGNCVDEGKDVTQGGMKYNWNGPYGIAIANAGNSLMGVKKAVFDDKVCTMAEMADALENDFEGREDLRQYLLNKVPHYGNDDPEADSLAKYATDSFFDKLIGHKTIYGGNFVGSLIPVSSFVAFGLQTGATAAGRHSKDPLADGISPSNGTDLNGPTAVLKSVCALDHLRSPNGVIFNMKLDKGPLETEEGLEKFMDLIRTYIEMGGGHIQFNVVSAETLRDAQKNPDKHKGMVVRVAGYSAFFNELSREVQDGIIGRTEHKLG